MSEVDAVRLLLALALLGALVIVVARETFRATCRVWRAPTRREAAIEGGAAVFAVLILSFVVDALVTGLLP